MKTFLKWAGIFLAVLLVAFVVALPFFSRFAFGFGRRLPLMGGGFHRFPMMSFGGMWLWMALRGLIGLVILGLIIWGVVALVRHLSRPAAAAPAPSAPVAAAPVDVKTCATCGQVLNAEWTHCPHCGAKIENG